jgi:hypothetical protein
MQVTAVEVEVEVEVTAGPYFQADMVVAYMAPTIHMCRVMHGIRKSERRD